MLRYAASLVSLFRDDAALSHFVSEVGIEKSIAYRHATMTLSGGFIIFATCHAQVISTPHELASISF